MRSVLITGGAGYLGGRLFKALSCRRDFHLVLGVRNPFLTKTFSEFDQAELRYLDMLDELSFLPALKGIDTVIHLAALNAQDSQKDAELARKVNQFGTTKLAVAAKEQGIKSFIFFSTFHVYGKMSGVLTEETMTIPTSVYALTHLEAEHSLLENVADKEFNLTILRLSNAFGSPINKDVNVWSLIGNDLCRQAFEQGCLILKTSGDQKRNFISIFDIEDLVCNILLNETNDFNGTFNVGGEKNLSIYELAQIIQKKYLTVFQRDLPLFRQEGGGHYIDDFVFDCKKIKNKGFLNKGTLEQEIVKAFDTFPRWFIQKK